MKFLNILVLSIKKGCKILWVPIMPGTHILWVPDFFLFLNIPYLFALTYYGLKRMEEEQGLFIQ
jgi:hypothetical protein